MPVEKFKRYGIGIDQVFRENQKRQEELIDNLGKLVKELLSILETGGKVTMVATKDKKPRFTIELDRGES